MNSPQGYETKKLDPPSSNVGKIKEPFKLLYQLFSIYCTFYITVVWSFFKYYFFTAQKPLVGEVVLITGSGRGLGKAMALEFAKYGARLALVDVDDESNRETATIINNIYPGKAKAYTSNIGSNDELKSVADKIMTDFDHVDILVNNAAVMAGGSILEFNESQYDALVNINLTAHMKLIKQFLPTMLKMNHGHIVGISSSSGLSSLTNGAAYTASKWGVLGLMESLREELRKNKSNKIKTTTICPYFINTSSDYSNAWNIRVPEMSVEYAAKLAVAGIRRNETIFTIPGFLYYPLILWKLLPTSLKDSFRDIFYAEIVKPELLLSKNSPITKILETQL